MAGGQRFVVTSSGRGSIHILHRKNKSGENGPLAIKIFCRHPANFLAFTVALIGCCAYFVIRMTTKQQASDNSFMSTKTIWVGNRDVNNNN